MQTTPVRTGKGKLEGINVFISDGLSCNSSRNYVKKYEEFIVSHGARPTNSLAESDIILIDTCAFSKETETKSIENISEKKLRAKKDAMVIVCGCLVQINPEKLRENYDGHFFSLRNEKHLAHLLGLDEEDARFLGPEEPRGRFMTNDYVVGNRSMRMRLQARRFLHKVNDRIPLEWFPVLDQQLALSQGLNSRTYSLTVSQGCLGNCSFCVIPLAKGRTVSVPAGVLIEQIRAKVEDGVRDIFLTSEDVGAYGQDIKTSIIELLKRIHDIRGDFRLYLNFFDPRWLVKYPKEIVDVLARGRVRYLHPPLQSGSDSVLRRMRRAYQMKHVVPVLEEIRKRAPKLYMANAIIVGFPGETEQEFEETRKFVRRGLFHRTFLHGFSDRPGADAEKLDGHLTETVIAARMKLLRRELPFWKRM